MFKARAVLLGALALLVVSGFAASTASAANPAWKINGQKLGAQVKRQIKATAGQTELKSKITGLSVTITCLTAVITNSYVEGNGAGAGQGGAASITFTKCTQEGLGTNCIVNEPIQTKQLKSHLITYGPGQGKIGVLFEPSQAQEFAVIGFKNGIKECSVNGTPFPVKGSVAAELRTLGQTQQEPLESQYGEIVLPKAQPITPVKLEGQEVAAGLFLGAEKATFAGKFETALIPLGQTPEALGVFYG